MARGLGTLTVAVALWWRRSHPVGVALLGCAVGAAGEAMLSPTATRRLITRYTDSGADARRQAALARIDTLTDREREVLLAVGRGLSNAEIGQELFLSEATVKSHITRVFTKLEAADRVQAAILAHVAGLV